MSAYLETLAKICTPASAPNFCRPLMEFITTGEEDRLRRGRQLLLGQEWSCYVLDDVWSLIGSPPALSVEETRGLRVMAAFVPQKLVVWLQRQWETPTVDHAAAFAIFQASFGSDPEGELDCVRCVMERLSGSLEGFQGQPNAAGKYLLSLSDETLNAAGRLVESNGDALGFLCRHAANRVAALTDAFLQKGESWNRRRVLAVENCRRLLDLDAATYEPVVAQAMEKESSFGAKTKVLRLLGDRFPAKYLQAARAASLQVVAGDGPEFDYYHVTDGFRWLMGVAGVVGAAGLPEPSCRLTALGYLVDWNLPEHSALLAERIEAGFGDKDSAMVIRFIQLAGRWQPTQLEPALWKLFEHKSKPVRMAVARSLARAGDAAVHQAIGLLSAKKSATRAAAVALLSIAQTDAGSEALEARVDQETDEEVRDQILLALERVWEKQGRVLTRADVEQRVKRAAAKIAEPVAAWVQESRLPPLSYIGSDAQRLDSQTVRYLLYRQSRAKDMRPDVEVKPLYALIDHSTSGDFALALLQHYLGSAMSADDRWALAVAAILGDDRIVPVLMQQIRKWVDINRGKLAEYAAQALALLGTDTALCAVDTLSIRYRSKQKNIGKAATEAFADAADRLGITVDELGDRVVPWLGFEPGKPRLIAAGAKQIEARVSLDFKIEFRDREKGKKIASLPASAGAEVKEEFKELGATLREVLKGQLTRLENLMVRQFRWPVSRWEELFLHHPVLFPFAARLAWGAYDSTGKLVATFRALEDHTLTNETDDAVELPSGDATVGILHPLELTPEQRGAWRGHFADYGVETPFLQMERPVVFPTDEQKGIKFSSQFSGTQLNAMTFRGRAERLGWQRGSVVDGGSISSYRKNFPGAGADAILGVEGL
ncbi:MAG: DUF4132 domain-containing protein, partial [Planctomycetota bacterium]|nr:DUF4132 domain-containing protein [Planctomycetota bacterium]